MPSLATSLVLAFTALAASPLHAQHAATVPPGWIQERPVPKPPKVVGPMPHWYEVRGGSWQVSLETLRQIATRLKPELDGNAYFNKPGAEYAIQFRGDSAGGRRIVRLFGTCSTNYIPDSMLTDDFMVIYDGGKCNFEAEYDPAEDRLSFRYHGYA